MSNWVALGAFAAGLLVGRKKGARTVKVPPKIVYVPVSENLEKPPSYEDIRKQVYEIARKRYGKIDEELIENVAREMYEYARLLWLRDYYTRRINDAAKAFSQRRISRNAFNLLVRYYKKRLLEVELKLREMR